METQEQTSQEIKDLVKERYAAIASQPKEQNAASCCGVGGCGDGTFTIFSEDYSREKGYAPEADLGLGCGLPLSTLQLKEGETVLDLGSGAGNDAFVARAAVGEKGRVIGVDFTPAMVAKARENADRLGYNNVEFREGDIENLPVGPARIDVVTSNCVLNLVPDKQKAFNEIFRVLKPEGRFSISDVVVRGKLPDNVKKAAEMIAGCVGGAVDEAEYLSLIHRAGFEGVKVVKEKTIDLPDDVLASVLAPDQIASLRASGAQVKSITVAGVKPNGSCGCGTACC